MSRIAPMQSWNDWVDPADMAAMWSRPAVALEWRGKGFQQGSKVLFTRDEKNKPYLTMTELRGVAEIVIDRHFRGRVNLVSPCDHFQKTVPSKDISGRLVYSLLVGPPWYLVTSQPCLSLGRLAKCGDSPTR